MDYTAEQLATAAADAVYPPGSNFTAENRSDIYRKALRDIIAGLRSGSLRLAESFANLPIEQRPIQRPSGLDWWRRQLLPQPPAALLKVILPAPGDPRGDYTLRQVANMGFMGSGCSQLETQKRIAADARAGRLLLAIVAPEGSNYLDGSRVTRRVAAEWLIKHRYPLPDELREFGRPH